MAQIGLGNLQQQLTNNLHIKRYGPYYFQLNNQEEYQSSIALLNDHVYTDHLPPTFSELAEVHCQQWFELRPSLILIGTGNQMHFLDPQWQFFFYQKKIGIETMTTEALCRTFAILANDDRNALGIFFPIIPL